jgi:hypothetical protein
MNTPAREQTPEDVPEEKSEFVPRGTAVFLTLMLIIYAAYWAYLWFVVTIQRGMGG